MQDEEPPANTYDYALIMETVIDRARQIDKKQNVRLEYQPNFIAIVEEVGEVAKALMTEGDAQIRDELIDVMVATMRLLREFNLKTK